MNVKDCLMTMNWMTFYDTYTVLSARWKSCVEYIGPKVFHYGLKMEKLGSKEMVFVLEHDAKIVLGDCITFMTREMKLDPSSKWFGWKLICLE